MFGTYERLHVPVWESNLTVIRAARTKLRDPWCRDQKQARKAFYRQMIEYHKQARDVCIKWRL